MATAILPEAHVDDTGHVERIRLVHDVGNCIDHVAGIGKCAGPVARIRLNKDQRGFGRCSKMRSFCEVGIVRSAIACRDSRNMCAVRSRIRPVPDNTERIRRIQRLVNLVGPILHAIGEIIRRALARTGVEALVPEKGQPCGAVRLAEIVEREIHSVIDDAHQNTGPCSARDAGTA